MRSGTLALKRWSRPIGWIGVCALVLGCGTAWAAPQAAFPAARFAIVCCLQPALGCLVFSLIHRITGGQWGESLRGPLAAGVRMVPWIWPILALLALARYARPDLPLPAGSAPMPTAAVLGLRAIAYEGILIGLSGVALRPGLKRYAAPALIALVFTGHWLAADSFFVLEPGWYSTGFPLVWLAICAASGLAVSILVAAAAGFNPAVPGSAQRPVGLDWGNLLLTAVVFSTYLAFMEYLVIWSSNLPAEISWFLRRERGIWPEVAVGLGVIHLGFPFLLLLSRRWKESPRGAPVAAAIVAAAGILWAMWLVLPPFADRGAGVGLFGVLFLVGGSGLFANRYLAAFCAEELP